MSPEMESLGRLSSVKNKSRFIFLFLFVSSPLYLVVQFLLLSFTPWSRFCIQLFLYFLCPFFLAPLQCCVEYWVVFSSLRYTAVRVQNSGWCEISHFSDSQQTCVANLLTVTCAITSETVASKYWKTFWNLLNVTVTIKAMCDLKQSLSLSTVFV